VTRWLHQPPAVLVPILTSLPWMPIMCSLACVCVLLMCSLACVCVCVVDVLPSVCVFYVDVFPSVCVFMLMCSLACVCLCCLLLLWRVFPSVRVCLLVPF